MCAVGITRLSQREREMFPNMQIWRKVPNPMPIFSFKENEKEQKNLPEVGGISQGDQELGYRSPARAPSRGQGKSCKQTPGTPAKALRSGLAGPLPGGGVQMQLGSLFSARVSLIFFKSPRICLSNSRRACSSPALHSQNPRPGFVSLLTLSLHSAGSPRIHPICPH